MEKEKKNSKLVDLIKSQMYKGVDSVTRGKLKGHEIPLEYQPDFVKKDMLKKFPGALAKKILPIEKIKKGAERIGNVASNVNPLSLKNTIRQGLKSSNPAYWEKLARDKKIDVSK